MDYNRENDFYGNEKSITLAKADTFKIEFVDESGAITELRAAKPLLEGEILDATVMRMAALEKFIAEQMADAKAKGVLFSVHLKATMMKVSDPVLFGAFVRVFFKDVCTSAWKATPRKPKSRPLLTQHSLLARTSPWSIPRRVSPTCTYLATSSSTPQCPR